MSITLLHVPPSFYSQIARLGLAEKGVPHRQRFVIAGPPAFDSYRPWYMRLNPQGTVPTLLVDGIALADSRDILEQPDARFDGPPLTPAIDAAHTQRPGRLTGHVRPPLLRLQILASVCRRCARAHYQTERCSRGVTHR